MSAYHHGDLRRALLDAANTVLAERGVGALSLRDLARRTGVSATAPYHHFRSKADLVCALAEDALQALDAALAEADAAYDVPADRLRAMGVAYVHFAVQHPERFRLAFRPEMGDPFEGLVHAGEGVPEDTVAFRHLAGAVGAMVSGAEARTLLALAAWSQVHGLASLLVDGPLRPLAEDPSRVRTLAHAVTDRLDVS